MKKSLVTSERASSSGLTKLTGFRLGLLLAAMYSGSCLGEFGFLIFANGSVSSEDVIRTLNPLTSLLMILGVYTTPLAAVVFTGELVFSYFYVRSKAPMWTCVAVLVTHAGTIFLTLRTWVVLGK